MKRGLGRDLAALLPTGDAQLRHVDIDLIVPNPSQPREMIDLDKLADLAESIRQHGVLQPIVVTETVVAGRPSTYQIIAGERRWQAAKLAGLERVPVVIKEATSQQILEWALVENIQRADLSPLEEAAAFKHLVDTFGLTQEAVADRVGRSRSSVTNTMRLLRLPAEVKDLLAAGQLTEGHARALLTLDDPEAMVALALKVADEGWTVRRLEAAVRPTPQRPAKTPDIEWAALETRLRESLGTKVDLTRSKKGGRLVIHFYSDDDLTQIVSRIRDQN